MMDALVEELAPAEGKADPASTFIWLDVLALNISERAMGAREMCSLFEEVQGCCPRGESSLSVHSPRLPS